MELIQSFSVDHTKIVPGIFVSRIDEVGEKKVTTYDIRLKRPNIEP
ncbi:MAG: S-ribosylhomocysteine lyase, partial [Clostridia bacterium]|nr:S-ribosylhomocysteine lyase [Clostridia bacterium]